jgi:hypothetical protein
MARVFEFDLELHGIAPPVWRRVRVPADLTLADLHRVIQIAMRWEDVHRHVFDIDGREFGPEPEEEEIFLDWGGDDAKVLVSEAVAKSTGTFEYVYDFVTEHRVGIRVAGELTGMPALIVCVQGDGNAFDADDINARLTAEFHADRIPAGSDATPEQKLFADLTLLLLFLGSYQEGKGRRVSDRTMRLEVLDALDEAGLVQSNAHRKSVVLTANGIARAERLLNRYLASS